MSPVGSEIVIQRGPSGLFSIRRIAGGWYGWLGERLKSSWVEIREMESTRQGTHVCLRSRAVGATGGIGPYFDIFDVMYVAEYIYLFSPLLGAILCKTNRKNSRSFSQ